MDALESGSVSGFDSDAGDVAAFDWTLRREEHEEEGAPADGADADAGARRPAAAADAAPAPPPPPPAAATTTTSTSEWASDDDDDDSDEEDEEDDEEEHEEDDEEEEAEDDAAAAAAAAAETDDDDDERPPTPTHARLLRLAYTVGSRVAAAAAAAASTAPAAAAATTAAAAAATTPAPPPPLPRRPLQCAIVPLPVPPKPPHPPLLQCLDAAVAGACPPRGGATAAAAAALDRLGAPLSACRRALLLPRGAAGGLGSAAGTTAVEEEDGDDDEEEDEHDDVLRGGLGAADDDDDDEEEEEDDDDDDESDDDDDDAMEEEQPTPQRRSARLAARAGGGAPGGPPGGNDDDDEQQEGADAAGARDQQQQQQQQRPPPSSPQRAAKRRAAAAEAAAANNPAKKKQPPPPQRRPGDSLTVLNTARLLLKRDLGLGAGGGGAFSRSQRLHASALPPSRALPTVPRLVRDQMPSRAYVGQFSADGALFVAAYQDRRVRLYDVGVAPRSSAADDDDDDDHGGGRGGGRPAPAAARWRLRKDISTRLTRWTVTDTALSPDGRYLVYSSITPVVWLVDVGAPYDPSRVDSRANETQLHDALSFAPPPAAGGPGGDPHEAARAAARSANFGVWSVAWAPGAAGELVAGTSDRSALVYDMGAGRPVARLAGHGDDVNAVAHLDPLSPHLVATGSDDALVRLWDRRVGGRGAGGGRGVASARQRAGEAGSAGAGAGAAAASASSSLSQTSTPVGVWIGHTEGVTHLCPRGDGRLLLSNAKDQSARIWDARSGLRPPSEARALPPVRGARGCGYDYRWEAYPYRGHDVRHPHDSCVQIFRGHSVLQSLIRAYFSPADETGGRYVYSGSADGAAVVWDAATAEVVARLSGAHGAVVRDVSWSAGALVTASWDGRLIEWQAPGSSGGGGGIGDDE